MYEIEVDDVGPSLRNASAKVNKVARSNGNGGAQAAQGGTDGGRAASSQEGNTDPWAGEGSGYSDEPPF